MIKDQHIHNCFRGIYDALLDNKLLLAANKLDMLRTYLESMEAIYVNNDHLIVPVMMTKEMKMAAINKLAGNGLIGSGAELADRIWGAVIDAYIET